MLRFVKRSIGRKLLVGVGLPSLLVTLALVLWLRHEVRLVAPGLLPLFGYAMAGILGLAAVMAVIQLVALRLLLELPLQRLAAAMRRASEGDFLQRVDAGGDDELGQLARTFNSTLAAITDLHVRRLDDAASLAAMQRELALTAQVQDRVRELELLHALASALSAAFDLDTLARAVAGLAAERLPDASFALLLADEATGELVIRGVARLDEAVLGTRLAPGAGLAGEAVASGRLARAAGPEAAAALPGASPPPGAALAVPLLHQEGCAGAIVLGLSGPGALGADVVRLVEAAAGLVATSVENVSLHQTMVRLSRTDALTGAQNRRQLFARLERERERAARLGEPFALLLVDVDRFRELNDAVGHATGDAVLREMAALLGREVRAVDAVARFGGEEFAVVLPLAGAAEAAEWAERIRAAVAGAAFQAAPGGRLTVSVGGACFPADGRDVPELLDAADAALFAAKQAGRDTWRLHAEGMRTDPQRRRGPGARQSPAELPSTSCRPVT